MKIKYFLLFALSVITLNSVNAQKVKFKGDKVLLDGEEVFKFDRKGLGTEISIFSLEDNDEILYMTSNENGTRGYYNDDYIVINFFEQRVKFESEKLSRNWKKLLATMFKEQVISENGIINLEKLNKFVSKYSRY
ncbi:hypothetical protein [uncultured Dokdonia sp.]|uniref:hypothetical protein n=1 Tax=uncultured Dokdonia sp. TaxID=575653 RepID=UPI0026210A28|nr:hypothetical protein [uncultured Dokdonia sp.]